MKSAVILYFTLCQIPLISSGSLIGYWDFESAINTVNIPDRSGSDNDGELFGSAFLENTEPAAVGNGFLLLENGPTGGGTSYFAINPESGGMRLNDLPEFSVSLWVNSSADVTQLDRRILSEASTTSTAPLYNLGTASRGDGSQVDFHRRTDDGTTTNNHFLTNASAFGDGTWHHVVITDAAGTVTIYIDGNLDSEISYTDSTLTTNTTVFGAIQRATVSNGYTGSLDEIAVYDTAISISEVQALNAKLSPLTVNDDDTDGDGLPNYWETLYGVSEPNENSDSDGLTNIQEFNSGTNPTNPDSDGDLVNDDVELADGTSPLQADSDGDGLDDNSEKMAGTNPNLGDSDGDLLSDSYEVTNMLNPLDNGLDPNNLGVTGNPNNGAEGDPDNDDLTNTLELANNTDPQDDDTDDDGLKDGEEITTFSTNPLEDDVDGDMILDGEEVSAGLDNFVTNPFKADTDNDGINDNVEIANGSDPTNPSDPELLPELPTEGLIHLWTMDADDSFTDGDGIMFARDLIGGVNAEWFGTDDTITFISDGQIGGAANLDGDNGSQQYFTLDTLAFDGGTQFSISFWFQADVNNENYNGMFMSRPTNWGVALKQNDTTIDFRYSNADTSSRGTSFPELITPDGETWHHVIMSVDTDIDRDTEEFNYRYALNGEVIEANYDGASTISGTGWAIGGDGSDGTQSQRDFDGRIDDVAVWNRTLSRDEMLSVFRNGGAAIGLPVPAVTPLSTFFISDFSFNEGGSATVTFDSDPEAGTTYTVIGSTDLSSPQSGWTELATADTGGTSTTITTDLSTIPEGATYFIAVRKNEPTN